MGRVVLPGRTQGLAKVIEHVLIAVLTLDRQLECHSACHFFQALGDLKQRLLVLKPGLLKVSSWRVALWIGLRGSDSAGE